MNYAIVLSSRTGNTEILAQKIKETLSVYESIYYGEVHGAPLHMDIVFVGFWTDKGTCD